MDDNVQSTHFTARLDKKKKNKKKKELIQILNRYIIM